LLYLLLDTIVEDYSNVADGFVRRVAEIEEVLFGGGHSPREFLQEVFSMRNDLRRFRRSIAPMREILTSIIHSPGDIFKADEVAYYRDVRDHAVRAIDEIDAAGDAVSSALDMQFRLENQRQGDVVKQLTVIATIFLPLTFITGFFGQNFGWLVTNIASLPTFLVFGIVLEIATVASLLLWFKVKRWL
ncbi:MAG TPA: CorA family divalent cation transporter, partial [Candidatus Acidoferrales bacterium]|nr:CorA family divalent cation transporter [Candidatus Acidoferrales bacterium]